MTTTTTPTLHNWPELRKAVENNCGVFRVSMATLRELDGRQRVGKHVLASIKDRLTSLGLDHLPETLPNRQQKDILLYQVGTPASEVINAVRMGGTDSPTDAAYEYLYRLNAAPEPGTSVPKAEVDEVVKAEVSEAIENTAQTVLQMLAYAHPNAPQGDNGKAKPNLELIASLTPPEAQVFSDAS